MWGDRMGVHRAAVVVCAPTVQPLNSPTHVQDPTVLGPYYDMLAYVIMVHNEYLDPFAALPSTLDVLRIVVLNFEQIPAFQIKSHLHV